MAKQRLEPGLKQLFRDGELDDFTILELRDAYAVRFGLGSHSSLSELRKWLYRRVLYLNRRGSIERFQTEVGDARYKLSSEFVHLLNVGSVSTSEGKPACSDRSSVSVDELRARQNQYQVDMLTCAGECKEYQRLAEEFPHLRSQIEPLFKLAKERSSELLGQVRAIGYLLEEQSKPH